jgi:hypothetical protein
LGSAEDLVGLGGVEGRLLLVNVGEVLLVLGGVGRWLVTIAGGLLPVNPLRGSLLVRLVGRSLLVRLVGRSLLAAIVEVLLPLVRCMVLLLAGQYMVLLLLGSEGQKN